VQLLLEKNAFEGFGRFLDSKRKNDCVVYALQLVANVCAMETAVDAIIAANLLPAIFALVHPSQQQKKASPSPTQQILMQKLSKAVLPSVYDMALETLVAIANTSAGASAIVHVDAPEGHCILASVTNLYFAPSRDHITRKDDVIWVLLR
jgi:hypothetical protein